MGKAIYAIDAFPDDAQLWRIDWIGGVAYNASVPSEPLIDVCLARLPKGETNPLSARSRSSETKFVAKFGVGLLPFISTASVWQKGRPVATDCAAYRRQLTIDTRSCRTEMLGDLTANYNGIPRSYYRFGFRGLLATCPRDSPGDSRTGRRSLCCDDADNRNHSVLLRALDAPGSSLVLGGITGIRPSLRFPTSRAMIASNPVQSTTTKRRFCQRMILPGVNSTDSLLLMFRLLNK